MLVQVTGVLLNWPGYVFVQYRKPYAPGKPEYNVLVVAQDDTDPELFEEAKQLKVCDWIDVDEQPKDTDEQETLSTSPSTTPLARRTTWKRILRDRRK